MHLLVVTSMRLLTIIHACAIYRIQVVASLSDEDAVYLIETVVGGLHICNRVRSPTVCEGLQLTETMTVLLRAFRCKPSLSVGWLAIQGSLESGFSARAIFVTREHKSTNLTRVTSVCA